MCEPDWFQTQPTFDAALGLSICWNTVHEYNLVTHMKELNSSRSWGNIRSRSPGHQNWKMFLMDSFRFSLPFAHASTFLALDVKIQMWGRCPRKYFSRILPLFRDLIILFTSFLVVGRDKGKSSCGYFSVLDLSERRAKFISRPGVEKKYWTYITQTLCTFFFGSSFQVLLDWHLSSIVVHDLDIKRVALTSASELFSWLPVVW